MTGNQETLSSMKYQEDRSVPDVIYHINTMFGSSLIEGSKSKTKETLLAIGNKPYYI